MYNSRYSQSVGSYIFKKNKMAKGNYKHGYFGTPTYKSWGEMLYRCRTNGKYWKDKGIKVCNRWNKFENFLLIWEKDQKVKALTE